MIKLLVNRTIYTFSLNSVKEQKIWDPNCAETSYGFASMAQLILPYNMRFLTIFLGEVRAVTEVKTVALKLWEPTTTFLFFEFW